MGIDGLISSSTNETKVIDVRDFSGEGDVKLVKADLEKKDDTQFLKDGDHIIRGIEKLTLKPVDNKYYIGYFGENRLLNSNSNITDINGNGKNDDYGIVVFKTGTSGAFYWVAYFDTNADGFISDEKPIRSYSENFDIFKISNPERPAYFTFAVNIDPEKKMISLFFDDGGHGTHVAGIASGYRIGGTESFNGVAPGSKIIALKIGNNTLSGGATVTESMKKAFLYADSVSRAVKQPCIVNMSFGIGSVYESYSDMELFLEGLLTANKYLYVCISNGNNGPGISSSDLPASSRFVFSSGAILTKEVGRDLYGTSLTEDIILHFSSRGGEVAKPDVCSPGACVSTVANYTTMDRFWGTSMASPYSAGVMSLLLSAVSQKYPDVKIPSQLLFKAVRESAVKMTGYTNLDQGGGFINVVNAYDLLDKFIRNKEYDKFEDYNISSLAPGMPDDKDQCLYIRNGLMLGKDDIFRFAVKRATSNDKFYRMYTLESDSDWLIPVQKKLHMRNAQGAVAAVRFDMDKISSPGLYNGKIKAFRDDKSRFPEFDLNATVIIPYTFSAGNNYKLNWFNEKLMPGRHKRYFLYIPPGTSSLTISMNSADKNYAETVYRLFNPDGVNIYTSSILSTDIDENEVVDTHFNLNPGVYELVLSGNYIAKDLSTVNLSAEIAGVNPVNNIVLNEINNKSDFINYFSDKKDYDIDGKMLGYKKDFTVKLNGIDGDHYEYPFILRKSESYKEFTLKVVKDDFNKMTDFSVLIINDSGKAVEKDGLNFPEGGISIINTSEEADSTNYKLLIIPAFTNRSGTAEVSVVEETYMKNPDSIATPYSKKVSFYPDIEKTIEFKVQRPSFYYPPDTMPFGKIEFKTNRDNRVELEFPLIYKN
jgi:subtilisin family serine protease